MNDKVAKVNKKADLTAKQASVQQADFITLSADDLAKSENVYFQNSSCFLRNVDGLPTLCVTPGVGASEYQLARDIFRSDKTQPAEFRLFGDFQINVLGTIIDFNSIPQEERANLDSPKDQYEFLKNKFVEIFINSKRFANEELAKQKALEAYAQITTTHKQQNFSMAQGALGQSVLNTLGVANDFQAKQGKDVDVTITVSLTNDGNIDIETHAVEKNLFVVAMKHNESPIFEISGKVHTVLGVHPITLEKYREIALAEMNRELAAAQSQVSILQSKVKAAKSPTEKENCETDLRSNLLSIKNLMKNISLENDPKTQKITAENYPKGLAYVKSSQTINPYMRSIQQSNRLPSLSNARRNELTLRKGVKYLPKHFAPARKGSLLKAFGWSVLSGFMTLAAIAATFVVAAVVTGLTTNPVFGALAAAGAGAAVGGVAVKCLANARKEYRGYSQFQAAAPRPNAVRKKGPAPKITVEKPTVTLNAHAQVSAKLQAAQEAETVMEPHTPDSSTSANSSRSSSEDSLASRSSTPEPVVATSTAQVDFAPQVKKPGLFEAAKETAHKAGLVSEARINELRQKPNLSRRGSF